MTGTMTRPRPTVLARPEWHPFTLLARCMTAAERSGWSNAEIWDFRDEATRADLGHMLETCRERFEVQ